MAGETLNLSVPADVGAVRIIRTVADGVAAASSLGFDTFDDLHLAIDEASGELIAHGADTQLECTVTAGDRSVDVVVASDRRLDGWPADDWAESLGAVVLQAVAADVRFEDDGTRSVVAFSVREV